MSDLMKAASGSDPVSTSIFVSGHEFLNTGDLCRMPLASHSCLTGFRSLEQMHAYYTKPFMFHEVGWGQDGESFRNSCVFSPGTIMIYLDSFIISRPGYYKDAFLHQLFYKDTQVFVTGELKHV